MKVLRKFKEHLKPVNWRRVFILWFILFAFWYVINLTMINKDPFSVLGPAVVASLMILFLLGLTMRAPWILKGSVLGNIGDNMEDAVWTILGGRDKA